MLAKKTKKTGIQKELQNIIGTCVSMHSDATIDKSTGD